jgi:hypothetical protein
MFRAQHAEQAAPARFECGTPFKPRGMHAISASVNIALQHPLKAE